MRRLITIIVFALLAGCSGGEQITPEDADAGTDGPVSDGGATDADSADGGDAMSGDASPVDASGSDSGTDVDAGPDDGGTDAGPDSGEDAGVDADTDECSDATDCNDGIGCTRDACEDGMCVHTTRDLLCDDGNVCNGAETCDAVEGCVSDEALDCDDGNACTADSCDPATGCESEPITCDDGNACTSDSCDPATGCVISPVSCDDGDACTAESCDPSTGCSSSPVSCDDGNPCTADSCDSASGCSSEPVADGTDCSVGGSSGYCEAGTCMELRPVVEVSAGRYHTCARRDDGTVWCWGASGTEVQSLGDGSAVGSMYPVKVVGIDDAVQVEAGGTQMCAIRDVAGTDDIVSCWGTNDRGQVGSGSFTTRETTPVDVSGIVNGADLALGEEFSCVLNQGSTDLTQCWGDNTADQLGNTAAGSREASPVWADASFGVEVDSFRDRTCAIRSSGEVWCWGRFQDAYNTGEFAGESLALGVDYWCAIDGTDVGCHYPEPFYDRYDCASVSCDPSPDEDPAPGTVPIEVVSGEDHVCILYDDGTLFCRGSNERGQVGSGSSYDVVGNWQQVMVSLSTPLTAVDISAGAHHTCAVEADGTTWCWGENDDHQLGRSTLGIDGTRHSTVPLEVTDLY